ncbi:hypothetical protein AVEN_165273-1 [Araneus ventricosus]|uniref:Uncharacterized protein n=1 Tax=Araneus ventricosus TaxID=182803 RepID=A0A4Y2AUT0_ARAVE|nr:hypothetical protein AVEN_165273-1 [Araneus ventricosus]
MVALREAMRWLSQEYLAKCTIPTDCQSSLKVLAALQPNSTNCLEILNIWSSLTTEVVISWVKGHSGVLGWINNNNRPWTSNKPTGKRRMMLDSGRMDMKPVVYTMQCVAHEKSGDNESH